MSASGYCTFSIINAPRRDELWALEDEQFLDLAIDELEKTSLIERKDVISGTLVRAHSGYSVCFDAYGRFGDLRTYLDRFSNLYPSAEMECSSTIPSTTLMLTANATVDASARS
jgi:hypothetical protein